MTLAQYVATKMKKNGTTVAEELRVIAKMSGVSFSSLYNVYRGSLLAVAPKAKAVSKATRGQVSVGTLLGLS